MSNLGATTTENGSDRSDKRNETGSIDEFVKKFLPTLPRTFKSLLDTPINVENDEPRELIKSETLTNVERHSISRKIHGTLSLRRLLGNLLGITDYATNMASFWFLDTLAFYVVRHRGDLDEYYTSVLISWLAGEIKLLRDRKHTREDFFREMRAIFAVAADKISEQNRVPYWDEIVDEYDSQGETEERLSTGGQSIKSLREYFSQDDVRFSSNIDPVLVLDIVIEDTYDMYANELRYALIYAVFVEPIEIQTYNIPFTFRTPRPIKLADPNTIPFNVQLQKILRTIDTVEKSKKSNAKGKTVKTIPEVPPTPPPSLDDEVKLMYNRSFILPLIEANESSEIFDTSDT